MAFAGDLEVGLLPAVVPLARINEMAVQRRAHLSWNDLKIDPSHAPAWVVSCLGTSSIITAFDQWPYISVVNGTIRGVGVGPNKRTTEDVAGNQAIRNMGWTQ